MKSSSEGDRTILLADDDESVRLYIKTVLQGEGYRVIEASDGEEAVEKFVANASDVSLLVLDVTMPKKSGRDAYADILKVKPDVKVLFVSGYAPEPLCDLDVIEKPFTPRTLLSRLAGMVN